MQMRDASGVVSLLSFTFFGVMSAGLLLDAGLDVGLALLLTFLVGGLAVVVTLRLAPSRIAAFAGAFGAAAGFAIAFASAATTSDADGGDVLVAALLWGGAAVVVYSGLVGLAHLVGVKPRRGHR